MKIYLAIVAMFLVFSPAGLAKNEYSSNVTVSPVQVLQLSLDGKYAFKLRDNIALTVPVTLQYLPEIEGFSSRYFAAGLGAKFFLSSNVFESGWYIEPSIMAGFSKASRPGLYPFSSPFVKTTVMGGYGWVFNNGVSINLGIGANYNYAFSHESPSISKVLWGTGYGPGTMVTNSYGLTSGFSPNAELSIGFSW